MKEEEELREIYSSFVPKFMKAKLANRITALVRAVREDCAKVAESHAKMFAVMADRARAKGHNVDDIVARRISSEDIAAAIRRKR